MRTLPVVASLAIGAGFLLGAADSPKAQPGKAESKLVQIKQSDLDALRADSAAWREVVDSARRMENEAPHDLATGHLYNQTAFELKLGQMLADEIERHSRRPLMPG